MKDSKSSLTTILISLNTSLLFLNHVLMTSVISGVYVILLIQQLPILSLPLSFILKLTIATLLLNLPAPQTNRLQLVLNSAARAVTKTPKFHHITPILKFLHWLKINERMQYKVLSHTYKSLQTGQPCYQCSLLSFTPNHSTCSSSLINLNCPSNSSRL